MLTMITYYVNIVYLKQKGRKNDEENSIVYCHESKFICYE